MRALSGLWRGLASCTLAVLCMWVAAACADSGGPSDTPPSVPLRPNFDASSSFYLSNNLSDVCRFFGSGSALIWVGPGSAWSGYCPVQPVGLPLPTMGTSNRGPVTFTFTAPVRNVQLGNFCPAHYQNPDCPTIGYSIYGPDDHLIASGTIGNAQGLFFGADVVIRKMVLTPPDPMPPDELPGVALDFVFDYYVPCPPTSDSVLNSLVVRGALVNELLLSRPNTNGQGKYERGGFVFRRADGTYYLQYRDDGVHTDCKVLNPPLPADVLVLTGETLVGYWHTHPTRPGEHMYHSACQYYGQGKTLAGDRFKNGGGSDGDWEFANLSGLPQYTISEPRWSTQSRQVARLDPGVDSTQRRSNPNRWKFDKHEACLVPTS